MSNNYGPRIVTDGLVLCLDAADRNSYPGTGTTWTDLSGNGNNGTLVNGPSFSSSNGGYLSFDGTNDFISFNPSIIVNTNTGFTIDTWIYINNPQPVYSNNWSYWYSIGVFDWEMGVYANGILEGFFLFQDSAIGTYPQVRSTQIGNQWANITFGCNQTSPFMYTNVNKSPNANNNVRNANITITNLCRRQTNGDRNFRCSHSNIKIYNKALSANEVQQNYNATKGRFGL